jgi:lysophospholipase L1-like esterase
MAHITLAGVLLDPTGEFSVGDRVKFTHQSTTGNTMRSAVSEIIVPPNGAYSIDLEYGLVLVEYNDYRLGQYRNLGVATVNATNTATSIPELLNAVVPASSAELIEFQSILSDCAAVLKQTKDVSQELSTGVVVFQTYAILTVFSPAVDQQMASFKVVNDPSSSLNGYYAWVSGTTYIKDASVVEGTIEESNTSDGVSGNAAFNFVNRISVEPISDLVNENLSNFELINGYRDSVGALILNASFRTTPLIPTVTGQTASYTGRTSGSAVRAIVAYDKNSLFHSVLISVTNDEIPQQITIPDGVRFIAFTADQAFARLFLLDNYVVRGKNVDISEKLSSYKLNTEYATDIDGAIVHTDDPLITFDWLGGGFAVSAHYSAAMITTTSSGFTGTVKEVSFESNSPTTATVTVFQVCSIELGVVSVISTHSVTGTATSVGSTVTFIPVEEVVLQVGQYLSITANDVAYTGDATGVDAYFSSNQGQTWSQSPSNKGFYYNYVVQTFEGVKAKILEVNENAKDLVSALGSKEDISNAVVRAKLPLVNCYTYDFSQPTTDWALSNWLVSGGFATSTTANDAIKFGKRYVTAKRVARTIVKFKANTVFRLGAFETGTTIETSIVINVVTQKLELYRKGSTTVVLDDIDIGAIVVDQEYIIELERQDTNSIARLINTKDGSVFEVSFDYISGNSYTSGAGNHGAFYFYDLVSGTSVSVKSLEIAVIHEPLIVFAGDSITDSNGRSNKNYAETLLEKLGGNGCIGAKTGAGFIQLQEMLDNEVFYIKPKMMSLMIGTNETTPTALEYQPFIDFCTTNDITLFLHHVVARDTGDHIAKNLTIDSLGAKGAKLDVATSLNYDITQGYDASLFSDGTHPNQSGNDRMATRVLTDIIEMRLF